MEEKRGKAGADRWVIALARVHELSVVTDEEPSRNVAKKPKIPGVCRDYGIKPINILGLIRENGWVYGAADGGSQAPSQVSPRRKRRRPWRATATTTRSRALQRI